VKLCGVGHNAGGEGGTPADQLGNAKSICTTAAE
jgi:hypothetical protein